MKLSATAHEDPVRAAAVSKIHSIVQTLNKTNAIKVRALVIQPPRSELSQTKPQAPMNMFYFATGEKC